LNAPLRNSSRNAKRPGFLRAVRSRSAVAFGFFYTPPLTRTPIIRRSACVRIQGKYWPRGYPARDDYFFAVIASELTTLLDLRPGLAAPGAPIEIWILPFSSCRNRPNSGLRSHRPTDGPCSGIQSYVQAATVTDALHDRYTDVGQPCLRIALAPRCDPPNSKT
jgi:hypothetical protein